MSLCQVEARYVELSSDTVFVRRPAALMELFVLLARDESLRGVTATTIRAIRDHLYLVDDAFRESDEVNGLFLELLRQPEGVYTQLQRMNRYGLLAAYFGQDPAAWGCRASPISVMLTGAGYRKVTLSRPLSRVC